MLTLAICDDDRTELERVTALVRAWSVTHPDEEINVRSFSSPYALLAAAERGEVFDMFLLDILMSEMSGIEVGEKLRDLYTDPLLIYLTVSEEYYPDAFRLYAFQYLCKPVHGNALGEVLDKALARCERGRQSVFMLKTAGGVVRIPLHTLVYVELLAHICHFHLVDGTALQSKYLRTGFGDFLAPLLQHSRFVRTHAAFAVNCSFVKKLASGRVLLTTGADIPVSRAFAGEVQRRFVEYALREEEEA